MVGGGSSIRSAGGPAGVVVVVVVWDGSVEVEVELAISGCAGGAEVTFADGSSGMTSIGVARELREGGWGS